MRVFWAALVLLAVSRAASAAEVHFGPFQVHQWLTSDGLKQEKIGQSCPAPIATSRGLAEWAAGRWNSANDLFVLVLQSRPRPCTVPAYVDKTHGLLEGGLGGTVAALRISADPIPAELGTKFYAYSGWPQPSTIARGDPVLMDMVPDASLKLALFCWPAKNGWPKINKAKKTPKAPFDAVAELDVSNACELWLVPMSSEGQPKLDATSYLVAGAIRAVKESKPVLLNDVDLPSPWGKAAAALDVTLPIEKLVLLKKSRFEPDQVKPAIDAGVTQAVAVAAADAGVVAVDAAVVAVVPAAPDGGAAELAAECTPACLPTCTSDQLASPALEDVRARVEQHLAAQELTFDWPKGGAPILKGKPTPRDCAAFELLMFTLSRHLSCQVPVARCTGVEK